MTWLPDSRLLLTAVAVGSLVTLVALTPKTATANNSNQVCCETESGTYNPVSDNGKAADSCVYTWDIPEDESPGQYCKLGPQDIEDPIAFCAARFEWTTNVGHPDPVRCVADSPDLDRFFCYLGFNPEDGDLNCCAQSLTGNEDESGCMAYEDL